MALLTMSSLSLPNPLLVIFLIFVYMGLLISVSPFLGINNLVVLGSYLDVYTYLVVDQWLSVMLMLVHHSLLPNLFASFFKMKCGSGFLMGCSSVA